MKTWIEITAVTVAKVRSTQCSCPYFNFVVMLEAGFIFLVGGSTPSNDAV